ncbi:SMI1/KNR4 family protein [Kitasatospora sp. NPDC059747]|uniref:SMI1/KNR4 family protein n=1 Tax=Kitasatospora sp. NPDC059747 TaxID=3346930 RepID=UPI00364C8CF9
MTEETFDWGSFLTRWSEEWADTCTEPADEPADEAARARGLGFGPAAEERIAAAEERLGRRLPPSYREFLAVSDGWRHAGGFIDHLAGAGEARWHEDADGLGEHFDEGELDGMWARALQLDVESDMTYVLLDPQAADEHGEWAVYCHQVWSHSPPTRHDSFREFMLAQYREFHRLAADHHAERPFANNTTRRLDAQVEAARLDALRGDHERAAAALADAAGYGRPRAKGMLHQLRRLLGRTYLVDYGSLPADPRYLREVVPLLAVEQVANRHDATVWGYRVGISSGRHRELADEVLREVEERTFRYTAEGPFGAAVEQAREQARWGRTDAAWHTLLAALPQWTPVGPDHLAPVGLLADPVLGPLVTPERALALLATPRDGRPAPPPTGGPRDADELAWLADHREAYRFVLVEGVHPADLPARLGAEDAALGAPATPDETHLALVRAGGGSSYNSYNSFVSYNSYDTYDDRARAAVGHAGESGWSFAFDAHPARHDEQRYVSPAAASSHGTRAVVVWSAPDQGFFHLSVAEQGTELYAFTVRGSEIHRTGTDIPPALDPDVLFAPGGEGRAERRALAAIAVHFGVGLPRFALTEGRLHHVTTRSWTSPPGPGETYARISLGGSGGR